jgi:hypothetical protein|eukprot:COSAG02_NODE_7176_length_3137_cov_1.480579_4_plen_65_part_00
MCAPLDSASTSEERGTPPLDVYQQYKIARILTFYTYADCQVACTPHCREHVCYLKLKHLAIDPY